MANNKYNPDISLPRVTNLEPVKCVKVYMSDEKEFLIKENDIIAVQFIRDDGRIVVRKGRVKDVIAVNQRELSTPKDNVSRIILDCSEQFSVKVIEIKFKNIIAVGNIDDEFTDYSDRIEKLEPNFMEGNRIPIRHHGMHSKDCKCNKSSSNGLPNKGIPLRK